MKFLIIFLISFNLWAAVPIYSVADTIKVTPPCDKMNMVGTIIKVWGGDIPAYMVEFPDGVQILLDENQITINP